ncbi:lysozyme g-like isoform X2 [Nothobranchius furzeri]|uniref:Lysozyme g n=3 Tax=Nothobranchius TaxID=28779 RepID=A0A1A8B5M9_NOTFU|nr:transcript variant X4 [Nothobranchius furzeri]KAF7213230.1 transcript variant X2 [Nothobranchius furzeri]KAF7213231.1 transcript variant X3 [Nothobranchius furzeri]
MSYGDIEKIPTTGASKQTAKQDGLTPGVGASETMARTDEERMKQYKAMIKRVGTEYRIDPALIAAIISRESRAGNVLQNGWGDHGNAWGLMQVDVNPRGGAHTRRGDWNSEEHLCQATEILIVFIERIQRKFPKWSKNEQLKGGIAAYNAGDGNIYSNKPEDVDKRTTGGDYSNDVVARAKWYKRNGF